MSPPRVYLIWESQLFVLAYLIASFGLAIHVGAGGFGLAFADTFVAEEFKVWT
jgi:hypothetical protein